MNTFPTPLPRIAEFERLGFGMFLHYGLYSVLGRGEKVLYFEGISHGEYKNLMSRFTAEHFSGRALAQLAKSAGMRYICLTTRHHDGFSLYDTCGLNDYDAPHSAAKRDLVADFVEGCNAEGIVPFLYHTTLDWWDTRFKTDFPAYLEYLQASVEILCKNYGKIGGFWFDGNWSKKDADWRENELYSMIRSYQPETVIINNGQGVGGKPIHPEIDVITFENNRPEPLDQTNRPKYLGGEMCQTTNDYWGYAEDDYSDKSPATLIGSLCACRRTGASYLMNFGPCADGTLAPRYKDILERMGKWANSTKAPLYNARPCGVSCEDGQGFALRDGKTVYLFVYGLCRADADGRNGVVKNGIRVYDNLPALRSLAWTDNGENLRFSQDGTKTAVTCTGFPYGHSFPVRIAVGEIAE